MSDDELREELTRRTVLMIQDLRGEDFAFSVEDPRGGAQPPWDVYTLIDAVGVSGMLAMRIHDDGALEVAVLGRGTFTPEQARDRILMTFPPEGAA